MEGGGVDNLAAAIGEARDTIEDVLEPFLISRASCSAPAPGRIATTAIYLGLESPAQNSQNCGGTVNMPCKTVSVRYLRPNLHSQIKILP